MDAVAIQRWRFDFQVQSSGRLPFYAGSMWRGAFGRALRRSTCLTGCSSCQGCEVTTACQYAQLFAPSSRRGGDRFKDQARHYIFHLPWGASRDLVSGAIISLEMSLLNVSPEQAKIALDAVISAAKTGLGRDQVRLDVLDAKPMALPQHSPAPSSAVVVSLKTPLRLRVRGNNLRPEAFRAFDLLSACLKRQHQLGVGNAAQRIEQRERIDAHSRCRLRWVDWERYSSSQRTALAMGGLLGEIELPPPTEYFPECWDALWQGQWTHIGKATVMGLGAYQIITKNFSNRDVLPLTGQA